MISFKNTISDKLPERGLKVGQIVIQKEFFGQPNYYIVSQLRPNLFNLVSLESRSNRYFDQLHTMEGLLKAMHKEKERFRIVVNTNIKYTS